jgi:hypothetical protein
MHPKEEKSGMYSIQGRVAIEPPRGRGRKATTCLAIASRREGGGRVRTHAAPVVGTTAVGDQGMALQDLAEVARFSVKRLSTKFYLFDTKKSDFL